MRFLLDAQLPKAARQHLHRGTTRRDPHLRPSARKPHARHRTHQDCGARPRVVVTKDRDFEVSHLVRGEPSKLLLVTTGNLTNRELAAVLTESLATITEALTEVGYVELTASSVVIRRDSQTS